MPKHQETKILPYLPEQVFDLVADVERYPEFLPWVRGARISQRDGDSFHADLLVGFKMIRERYTSKVTLNRPDGIDVTYTYGPFRYLENSWRFMPHPDGCQLEFFLDFEFKSRFLQRVIGGLFNQAVRKMVSSFENRARAMYGDEARSGNALPTGGPA